MAGVPNEIQTKRFPNIILENESYSLLGYSVVRV